MVQSKEYPDLLWIPPDPDHYTRGRTSRGVKFLVVHYTAGSEALTSAENGALYDQRREDNVSSHYYVDGDSIVQCVATWDMAHTARRHGNIIGIQYELCGTIQTRAQWLDSRSRPMIRNAARQMARDLRKYNLPLRWMTTAQTRAAYYGDDPGGITTHANCTLAFPEDNGDHMDPGIAFPEDVLLADIREFMEDETVALSESDIDRVADAVIKRMFVFAKNAEGEFEGPGVFKEYVDENGDLVRNARPWTDVLFATHKAAVETRAIVRATEEG